MKRAQIPAVKQPSGFDHDMKLTWSRDKKARSQPASLLHSVISSSLFYCLNAGFTPAGQENNNTML